MEPKSGYITCVLFVFLYIITESYCYQITGMFGCRDRYIWMIDGSVSCDHLTRPSKYGLHMNPKYYCTEYPLTKCCETCTILERNNYRVVNGLYDITTHMPTTTEVFTTRKAKVNPEIIALKTLKTFFTLPLIEEQKLSPISPRHAETMAQTKKAINNSSRAMFSTNMMQPFTVTPETTTHRKVQSTKNYDTDINIKVEQLFTLNPVSRSAGRVHPTSLIVKNRRTEDHTVLTQKPSPSTEKYDTTLTKTTVSIQDVASGKLQDTTIRTPSSSSSTIPNISGPTTTTIQTPSSSSSTPAYTSRPTTTTTTTATTIPPATQRTIKLSSTTKQQQLFKGNSNRCRDIGIWIIDGSVPCDYLIKENRYGLSRNQLYFCNRYPLTSCCETCESINRASGK